MTRLEWYAVEDAGPRPLEVPEGVTQFPGLYRGLPLGVYTALRTFQHNKFLYLSRHLARTERSMSLLGWEYRLDRARLLRALHDIVTRAEWPEMRVRIDVLAALPPELASRELIAIQPFSPPSPALYERGVAVDFAPGVSRGIPLAKTADFAAVRPATGGLAALEGNAAALAGPSPGGEPYELLLLDGDGRMLEGTGTNFWAVRDGVVYTAGEGVLEGITREIILQLIPQLGIPLRLEAVREDQIATLDEAALSGSSRALMPVVSIAGQAVGDGRPGPITRRILAAYHSFVTENIQTAV